MLLKLQGRIAIAQSWKGNLDEAIKIYDELLDNDSVITTEVKKVFTEHKNNVKQRIETNNLKVKINLMYVTIK